MVALLAGIRPALRTLRQALLVALFVDCVLVAPCDARQPVEPVSPEIIKASKGHVDAVTDLCFSPDGKTLASSSRDGTVRLWNSQTGVEIAKLLQDWEGAFAVRYQHDGKSLMIGDSRGVSLRDASTHRLIGALGGAPRATQRIIQSPPGDYLAANAFGKTIHVWDGQQRALKTLTTETYGWSTAALSPNGLLAVADADGVGVVYELPGFKERQRFQFGGYGMRLAFSPKGRWLAISAYEAQTPIRIWDLDQGNVVRQLILDTPAYELAFSPDGSLLAAIGGQASNATVPPGRKRVEPFVVGWKTDDWTRSFETHDHEEPAMALAFSPDGTLLATGGGDSSIRLSEPRNGQSVRVIAGERKRPVKESLVQAQRRFEQMGPTRCVAVSPKGDQVAAGGADQNATIWDVASGQPIHVLKGLGGSVEAIAYSPDGTKLLVAAGNDAKVFSPSTGAQLAELKGHTAPIKSATFLPDGNRAMTGSEDTSIHIWDVGTSQSIRLLTGHTAGVWTVAASSDGKLLASGGDDKALRLWNAENGELVRTIPHDAAILAALFTPDSKTLVVGAWDYHIHLWNPVSGEPLGEFYSVFGWTESLSVSSNGKILSASSPRGVKLWELESRRPVVLVPKPNGVYTCPPPDPNATDAAVAPDASWVASTGPDGNVVLTDFRRYLSEHPFEEHFAHIRAMDVSQDGSRLATGGPTGAIVVWNVAEGRENYTLYEFAGPITGLAFSPDGKWLAGASQGLTSANPPLPARVRLFQTKTGAAGATLAVSTQSPIALAFSPDSRLLATCLNDGQIQLLDVVGGQLVGNVKSSPARCVVFTVDGKRLLTAGTDGVIRIWSAPALQADGELPGHMGAVNCLALSRDGKWLASGSDDLSVRLWNWPEKTGHLVLDGLQFAPTDLRFTPQSDRVVAAFRGANGLYAWTVKEGAEYHTTEMVYHGNPDESHVALTVDGSKALTNLGTQLKTWNIASGAEFPRVARSAAARPKRKSTRERMAFGGQGAVVRWLEFLPSGDRLLGFVDNGVAKLWDVNTGKTIWSIGSAEKPISMARAAPDGKRLVIGWQPHPVTQASAVELVDATTGEIIAALGDHYGTVRSGVFSSDGKLLVTGAGEAVSNAQAHGELTVWDVEQRVPIQSQKDLGHPVTQLWFVANDQRLLAHARSWANNDSMLTVWEAGGWTRVEQRPVLAEWPKRGSTDHGPQVSAAGRLAGVGLGTPQGGRKRQILLWDTVAQHDLTSQAMRELFNPALVAISRDGKWIAYRSHQERIEIWNGDSGELVGYLRPAETNERPEALQFTADGTLLIAAGYHLSVWDHAARKCIARETDFGGPIVCVALSPDGRTMATAHGDTNLRIWSVPTLP